MVANGKNSKNFENSRNFENLRNSMELEREIALLNSENDHLKNTIDDLELQLVEYKQLYPEEDQAPITEAKIFQKAKNRAKSKIAHKNPNRSSTGSSLGRYSTSRSPGRSPESPWSKFDLSRLKKRAHSSKNVTFFVNFLCDLYISTAGIFRHCDHSLAKRSAKTMFDMLTELKDEEYQLRGELSDKVKRELRT